MLLNDLCPAAIGKLSDESFGPGSDSDLNAMAASVLPGNGIPLSIRCCQRGALYEQPASANQRANEKCSKSDTKCRRWMKEIFNMTHKVACCALLILGQAEGTEVLFRMHPSFFAIDAHLQPQVAVSSHAEAPSIVHSAFGNARGSLGASLSPLCGNKSSQ
jgi:hypothetical protein